MFNFRILEKKWQIYEKGTLIHIAFSNSKEEAIKAVEIFNRASLSCSDLREIIDRADYGFDSFNISAELLGLLRSLNSYEKK